MEHVTRDQRAFDLWDDALDRVIFVKTNEGNNVDIAIAIVNIDGRNNFQAKFSYTGSVNSARDERTISMASIMVDQEDIGYVDFLGLAMHEIGNVLGLVSDEQHKEGQGPRRSIWETACADQGANH